MTREERYFQRLKQLPRAEKVQQLELALKLLVEALTTQQEDSRQAECDRVANQLLADLDI